ncbi:MAG: transposase [Candidatus Tectomicrobia bacterium]|nr:transposase [Candidatus Tectomicrobia bacterium]
MRPTLRTNNPTERCCREARRRSRAMGGFTNKDSLERISYRVPHHLNTQWEHRPRKRSFTQNS